VPRYCFSGWRPRICYEATSIVLRSYSQSCRVILERFPFRFFRFFDFHLDFFENLLEHMQRRAQHLEAGVCGWRPPGLGFADGLGVTYFVGKFSIADAEVLNFEQKGKKTLGKRSSAPACSLSSTAVAFPTRRTLAPRPTTSTSVHVGDLVIGPFLLLEVTDRWPPFAR
jgi:hypothetical protein